MSMSASDLSLEGMMYEERCGAFRSVADYLEHGVLWFKKHMPSIVKRSMNGKFSKPYRVLAIGAGNGKPFDETLLDVLSDLEIEVIYTVVEPRETSIEEFKSYAISKYTNVKFQWFQTSYDDYLQDERRNVDLKFNLIHCIYSWYYIATTLDVLKEKISYCLNEMLQDGGAIVSFLANESGKSILICKTPLVKSPFLLAYNPPNVIGKLAVEEGWENEDFESNYKADLTSCFDEKSTKGNLILDFLTHINNFRQNSDKEYVQKVLTYLESQCETKENGSKIAFPIKLDYSVIWKGAINKLD